MTTEENSILLVLPVPFRKNSDGTLLIEKQACNGIDRWADNFNKVVVACPIIDEKTFLSGNTTAEYIPATKLESFDRVKLVTLPHAYRITSYIRNYSRTRKLLSGLIVKNKYLSFAIGGLIGDWASLAAVEAIKQKRAYSVWTDRVEHQVVKNSYQDRHGLRRIYRLLKDRLLQSWLMAMAERYVISRADLGMFHGMDCFETYHNLCREPHLVHNIHLKETDRISSEELDRKIQRTMEGQALRIVYVGRVAGMKGPFDWIETMSQLQSMGVDFSAVWLGDGPLLEEARKQLKLKNLDGKVKFLGHQGQKDKLLKSIRESDIFVFCHKTPESPRCLIEAMLSGTPIMGYKSPYPEDLLKNISRNLLTDKNDIAALAKNICRINDNREELANAMAYCHQISEHYTDKAVFSHRSQLIKKYLETST